MRHISIVNFIKLILLIIRLFFFFFTLVEYVFHNHKYKMIVYNILVEVAVRLFKYLLKMKILKFYFLRKEDQSLKKKILFLVVEISIQSTN